MTRRSDAPLRSLVAAGALLSLATFAVGCGGGGPSPEEVAAGREKFLKTCAQCHGQDANGMPKLGKGLHDNQFVQARSDLEMVEFLKIGRRPTDPLNTTGVDMPPRGGNPALTDQDLLMIIKFVRSLQTKG